MTEPILRVEGLTRAFAGIKAVDDLSFAVATGSITGLIGPNGSGKSTTIDCLSGFQRADRGRWFLAGQPLTGLPPHRIARVGLARSFQTVRAYDRLSLVDNLRQAAQEFDGIGWWAALAGTARLAAAEAGASTRADALLALVGLARYRDAPAAILSYGQRKLLALAATLMTSPRLIVLDEPVAGVNPTMIRQIETVIREISASGVSLLIVEHNIDFIMRLCGHVVVLDGGRKLAEGEPALIRRDARVLEAYLGSDVA